VSTQHLDANVGATVALDLATSRKSLEDFGIRFNGCAMANSSQQAVEMASKMGYPVVMKVVSPQIVHKTEAGGVKVNIDTNEEVVSAYDEIMVSAKAYDPNAQINGIMVEEMVSGTELIIGTTTDAQFGPMIMFGMGGIFVEVYKDVSFRLVPISEGDAREMIEEIKGKAILKGARGLPKADVSRLYLRLNQGPDVKVSTTQRNHLVQHSKVNRLKRYIP